MTYICQAMANDFPSGGNSTPWWYETPSLVSQTTHLTAFASSTDSNPLDITPSVSSGYFEEDDGSNISEGSYGGHFSGATAHMMNYHKMDSSSLSNSTLTSKGQMKSHQILSSSITGVSQLIYRKDKQFPSIQSCHIYITCCIASL